MRLLSLNFLFPATQHQGPSTLIVTMFRWLGVIKQNTFKQTTASQLSAMLDTQIFKKVLMCQFHPHSQPTLPSVFSILLPVSTCHLKSKFAGTTSMEHKKL